jgi:hypothetical protein
MAIWGLRCLGFTFHSTFDVGRSMFDVHSFSSPLCATTLFPFNRQIIIIKNFVNIQVDKTFIR